MKEEKIIDIFGVSYAFCDTIDDILTQSENDKKAMEVIRKDKELIFFAKELKNYFDNDYKKMDEFYKNAQQQWEGYDVDAVSDYIKTFFS